MLDQITKAVKFAFMDNQLPWLLNAITDWSYEEGGAPGFSAYTYLFEQTGTPSPIANTMRLGINGWLDRAFHSAGLDVTNRRKSHGYDFSVQGTNNRTADIESKLSYDCTLSKYYGEISHDRERLLESKADHAYQVVYIVSLPNYWYPAGVWNGKSHKARETKHLGIMAQWNAIRSNISAPTVFEGGQPLVLPFDEEVKSSAVGYLKAYFNHVYRPNTSWDFSIDQHLRDASVGIALWQWR